MPKFSNTRLSDTAIRNLKPGRERYKVLDASQPGFGIRVSKTGIKSWIVFGRINGKRSRKTLGTYPSLSLADARIRAREALRIMRGRASGRLECPINEPFQLLYPLQPLRYQ